MIDTYLANLEDKDIGEAREIYNQLRAAATGK